jgi:hypothetical protein
LGSGKSNADPFLRYVWSVFFDSREPNLNEAVLAAYWTVKVGIDLKSSGVGFDVDVFVLEAKDKASVTRLVQGEELAEASGFIKEAEDAWRDIRDRMRGAAGEIIAPPTMST